MGLFDALFRRSRPAESMPVQPAAEPDAPEETGPLAIRVANLQGIGEREEQEDSFAVLNATALAELSSQGLFALVADGMGGMEGGRQASEWAADFFVQLFRERDPKRSVPEWFYQSVHAVSDSVYRQFGGRSGTTLVAVHLLEDRLHWLSVGDSAIYLARDGGVFQLNREHTCLNQLYLQELEQPVIDKARAEQDEDARRLTSFVGIDRLAEVDLNLRPLTLKRGDALLVCSDGISGVLTPPELLEAMTLAPKEGAELLEHMVLEKGVPGQDNYTGILIACR